MPWFVLFFVGGVFFFIYRKKLRKKLTLSYFTLLATKPFFFWCLGNPGKLEGSSVCVSALQCVSECSWRLESHSVSFSVAIPGHGWDVAVLAVWCVLIWNGNASGPAEEAVTDFREICGTEHKVRVWVGRGERCTLQSGLGPVLMAGAAVSLSHKARLYQHRVSAVIKNWILHVACNSSIKYLHKREKTVFHQFERNWKSYLVVLHNLRESKRVLNCWKLQCSVDVIEVTFFGREGGKKCHSVKKWAWTQWSTTNI